MSVSLDLYEAVLSGDYDLSHKTQIAQQGSDVDPEVEVDVLDAVRSFVGSDFALAQ